MANMKNVNGVFNNGEQNPVGANSLAVNQLANLERASCTTTAGLPFTVNTFRLTGPGQTPQMTLRVLLKIGKRMNFVQRYQGEEIGCEHECKQGLLQREDMETRATMSVPATVLLLQLGASASPRLK